MKLLFLGTTGYHPNNRRQTACLMLPELGVVLDAGTGMFRVRDHLQTSTLNVFLTHAHLDHVLGLTFLFDVLFQKQVQRVQAYGNDATLTAVREHLFAPALFPVLPPLDLRPLVAEHRLADGARLTHFPLRHPGGSIAYRIDWADRSLAYVTDTTAEADAAYIDFIRGVDVLVHEYYFPDGWEAQAELTGHSCATPVATVAKEAGVGRLILVHLNPLSESDDPIGIVAARAVFPATVLAEDHMLIEF
jgi:ribonuclease Z